MKSLVDKIHQSQRIILSTHREGDGDGLGSQLALYYALKKLNKDVRVLNVDPMPARYHFLDPKNVVQNFESAHDVLASSDLALIFDTNDHRLVEPLFSTLKNKCQSILFIDHHPILKSGPTPGVGSLVDVSAASTGEIVYDLIKMLQVKLDSDIARCLHASIAFDTQLFRFIRSSQKSHQIAIELLQFPIQPEEIHRRIFGNQTIEKIAFLSKALSRIEYYADGRVALLKIPDKELLTHGLTNDASRDLVDMIMNIDTLEVAILVREDSKDSFKLSFRSKGRVEVLSAAERLGGGGHMFASGAYFKGPYDEIKSKILNHVAELIKK